MDPRKRRRCRGCDRLIGPGCATPRRIDGGLAASWGWCVDCPPPRRPPPAEPKPEPRRERSRSKRTALQHCANGCGRVAAKGFPTCCRTCGQSSGMRHGPRCERSRKRQQAKREAAPPDTASRHCDKATPMPGMYPEATGPPVTLAPGGSSLSPRAVVAPPTAATPRSPTPPRASRVPGPPAAIPRSPTPPRASPPRRRRRRRVQFHERPDVVRFDSREPVARPEAADDSDW